MKTKVLSRIHLPNQLICTSIRHLFKRPYDSRSNTSYTRRRRKRHKSRLSLESSPEEEEEIQERSPKISSNRNVNNSSRKSRCEIFGGFSPLVPSKREKNILVYFSIFERYNSQLCKRKTYRISLNKVRGH
jgi:hypothetical protein